MQCLVAQISAGKNLIQRLYDFYDLGVDGLERPFALVLRGSLIHRLNGFDERIDTRNLAVGSRVVADGFEIGQCGGAGGVLEQDITVVGKARQGFQ